MMKLYKIIWAIVFVLIVSIIVFASGAGDSPNPDLIIKGGVDEDDTSLVGYWKLNNDDKDYSIYGNDGTTYGATNVTGKYDGALSFDGTDDYVNVGNDNSLDLTDEITIEAWVKVNDSDSNMIVNRGSDGVNGYGFFISSTFGVRFDTYSPTKAITSSNHLPDIGVWTHVAVTYNGIGGVGSVRIYENGVDTTVTEGNHGNPVSNTRNAYIGYYEPTAPWGIFNGSIDEVRIYNRTLSAEEIKEHYEISPHRTSLILKDGTLDLDDSSLVGYWKLNSDSATDYSGQNNQGTVYGAVNTSDGKFGDALSFDGVNDYIRLTSTISFANGIPWTAEIWVKERGIGDSNWWQVWLGGTAPTDYYEQMGIVTETRLLFQYQYLGDVQWDIPSPAAGGWTHFIFIGSPPGYSGQVEAYRNGISLGKRTPPSGSTMKVGTIGMTGNNQRHTNGLIDEVRIYNRALSAEEIKSHYETKHLILMQS